MPEIVLSTEGLTRRYGRLVAVDDLSLDVFKGEVFGFLGPNGAGKTTAINMMVGLLRPDGGQVIIHDQPLVSGDSAIQAKLGLCPQEVVLWQRLTCIEQLHFVGRMYGLSGHEAGRNGETLLDELGLSGERNKQARALSGGMKRRLNLALALVHDPEIVVLDEPEAGLDPQSRVKVREYVQGLGRRKTVILTTHNMDEADRLADRVAIIDHGRLLVLDTPEALKRRVGEGDVLEIDFDGDGETPQKALAALASLSGRAEATIEGQGIAVRALDVVELLPAIMERLAADSLRCAQLRLRENTLEDVFIQLTGRSLRQ